MHRATAALVGEHDFAAFQGRGTDVKTTVRRVLAADIIEMNIDTDLPIALSPLEAAADGDGVLRFEISGTGFLRHMVRTIAGTLVDIGRGKWKPTRCARSSSHGSRASGEHRAASRA